MSWSTAMARDSFLRSDRVVRAAQSYCALSLVAAAPAPGGVPAHQPVPEVPAREHPLPSPQEVPTAPPAEVPVEVPQTPGPAAI